MPPYVSASDFVLTLPAMVPTITGSSIPLSIDEVATICARVGVELDSAAAGAGYAVPVSTTATQAYAQMALWQGYGAGWLVLRDIFPNMGGPGDNTSLAGEYRAQYTAALKNLRTGAEPLVGAALAGDGQGRELPRSYSVSNPGATSGVVPRFTVGDVF